MSVENDSNDGRDDPNATDQQINPEIIDGDLLCLSIHSINTFDSQKNLITPEIGDPNPIRNGPVNQAEEGNFWFTSSGISCNAIYERFTSMCFSVENEQQPTTSRVSISNYDGANRLQTERALRGTANELRQIVLPLPVRKKGNQRGFGETSAVPKRSLRSTSK